jgi:ATP phosphoribosyltransferase regulatory subunit
VTDDLSRVPPGVQYIFDDEVRLRRSLEHDILDVFRGWSYGEILLPAFDSYELFRRGAGSDLADRTYRFAGRDGRTMALRPELTSLVARAAATRLGEKPRPLRLCYSGEVFRADAPRRGRQHEFHQIGLEHIGSERRESDVEVLLIAIEVLARLGLDAARITLGHVGFFQGVRDSFGVTGQAAGRMHDMVDRRRLDALVSFLEGYAPAAAASDASRLFGLCGSRSILSEARKASNDASIAALDELDDIMATLEALELNDNVQIDLGEVSDLDYYTGMTFKVYVPGWGNPVGTGGRYDALLKEFGRDEPAVGFSLALDWLAGAMTAHSLDADRRRPPAPVRVESGADLESLFAKARQLRLAGAAIEIGHQAAGPTS